jgi:hypothetical protein
LFEVDLQTTPVISTEVYDNLNIHSHEYFNEFNNKLFDFQDYYYNYIPVLKDVVNIIREANSYFDKYKESYMCRELNNKILYIKKNSHYGAISQLYTPLSDIVDPCGFEYKPLLDKLQRIEEILC